MKKQKQHTTAIIITAVVLCLGLLVYSIISMTSTEINPSDDEIALSEANEADTRSKASEAENATDSLADSIPNSTKVVINNYADYVKNLSREEQLFIQQVLYDAIVKNNTGVITIPTDVIIRSGSYAQTYDESTSIYRTSFLVDIASLKQSFRIENIHSPLPREESGVSHSYSSLALCPSQSELIYGSFDCRDISEE